MDKLFFFNDKNDEGKRRFEIIINEYRMVELLLSYFEYMVIKPMTVYTPFDEDIELSQRLQYLNEFKLINDNLSEIRKFSGQTPFFFMEGNDNELGALFLGDITEKENGIIQWDNFTQGGRNKKYFKDRLNYDELVFQFNKEEYFSEIKKWGNEFIK